MFKRSIPIFLTTLALLVPSTASAASAGPGWLLESIPAPTHFSQTENGQCAGSSGEDCARYEVIATNAGAAPTTTEPVVLSDTLPAGVSVQHVEMRVIENLSEFIQDDAKREPVVGTCATSGPTASCTYAGTVGPADWLKMTIYVTVNPEVLEGAELANQAAVSGGGAPPASGESVNEVGSTPAPFGLSGPASFDFYKAALNGAPETQAGGHPYQLITTINPNSVLGPAAGDGKEGTLFPTSVEPLRDVVVDLPLGFAGSTLAAPQCPIALMASEAHCPPDTIVGHLSTEGSPVSVSSPLYNLVPEYGYPAEFGFIDALKGVHAFYAHVVPTPEGYVLQTVASEIPLVNANRIIAIFYGDPALKAAEEHQRQVKEELERKLKEPVTVPLEEPSVQVPFFTDPTACSNGAQKATIWVDSWEHPAPIEADNLPVDLSEPMWKTDISESAQASACNALTFTPELVSQPTTHQADSPSGLEFEQRLPQTENAGVPATPALKDTTIVFPPGMTVDPSSADGLGTCSDAQIGWEGPTLFDFSLAPPDGAGGCPENSKIGVLELETPLIPGKLYGEVFLAAQNANPFNSVFATYIVVNDPDDGCCAEARGRSQAVREHRRSHRRAYV